VDTQQYRSRFARLYDLDGVSLDAESPEQMAEAMTRTFAIMIDVGDLRDQLGLRHYNLFTAWVRGADEHDG
jgi:hypothetical protein